MDGSRFDGMARMVGTTSSRRRILTLLGGGLAGGLLTAAGLGDAGAAQRKRREKTCRRWILSGGPSPVDPIGVDDDLHVTVNGKTILNDANGVANQLPAVRFRAKEGASLAVVATDVDPYCRSITPLWLHCATSGERRQLSAGKNDGCSPGRTAGVFFSRTYRVKL